jgi:hypothetical protein
MNIFSVDLKNQPGELAHLCEALAQRQVNIELAGLTAGDHGLVSFTASDEAAARAALEAASVPYTMHPALQVSCPDRPGEAANVARRLADAHVNIDTLLPISICAGEVILAVCVDKPDEAQRVLGNQVVG